MGEGIHVRVSKAISVMHEKGKAMGLQQVLLETRMIHLALTCNSLSIWLVIGFFHCFLRQVRPAGQAGYPEVNRELRWAQLYGLPVPPC